MNKVPIRKDIPERLSSIYFGFDWSQQKLWALELPVEEMRVEDFIWLLDYPIWATNPPCQIFDLEPRKVLDNLDIYPKHRDRLHRADVSYPIHIMLCKGRWVILDGFHRLLKKIINSEEKILVKKVPTGFIQSISK